MKKCCICDAAIEREDAPALVMSISGNPKLLCDDCVRALDEITLGRDYDTIVDEIDKIGKKMSDNEQASVSLVKIICILVVYLYIEIYIDIMKRKITSTIKVLCILWKCILPIK